MSRRQGKLPESENGDAVERVLQILSTSARLFATSGYDGTSMRDIADACGISKSLLYHHFADKDEIFARIALGSTRELYQFVRSEEHTSELQSRQYLVCRLLLEKKKTNNHTQDP